MFCFISLLLLFGLRGGGGQNLVWSTTFNLPWPICVCVSLHQRSTSTHRNLRSLLYLSGPRLLSARGRQCFQEQGNGRLWPGLLRSRAQRPCRVHPEFVHSRPWGNGHTSWRDARHSSWRHVCMGGREAHSSIEVARRAGLREASCSSFRSGCAGPS